MKVLLIDVNCKKGSTGKIVYDLYSELNDCGEQAMVCYGRGPVIKEMNIIKIGIDFETVLHVIASRISGIVGFGSWFSTLRLIEKIKQFQPDVIHMHEMHGYYINYKILLKHIAQNNIPLIITEHCEFYFTGKCGYSYACEKWKTGCGHCEKLVEYPKSLVFDNTRYLLETKKRLYEKLSSLTIVSPSYWLAEKTKKSLLKEHNILVIPNGIDTNVFFYNQLSRIKCELGIENKRVVLSVAPNIMDKRKGGIHVLNISKRFNEEFVFVIVGAEEKEEKKYENFENVIIKSKTNNQIELRDYYSIADCFLICSDMENLPTTCIEAQCCGTKICGFSCGGTSETNVCEENNFVDYGDYEKIEEIIRRICAENYDKKELSIKAKQLYDRKRMFSEYYALYRKICEQKEGKE